MVDKIINIGIFEGLSTADYFAIKQAAYDFLGKYSQAQLPEYSINVLGYKGNEPEYALFASTVLYPIDRDFCEVYELYDKQFAKLVENFTQTCSPLNSSNPLDELRKKFFKCNIDLTVLEVKAYEVDHYQLDVAIEQGILNAPVFTVKKATDKNRKTQ